MKAKLNITVEAPLLNRIKVYAERYHTSISKLTEEYFTRLTSHEEKKTSIFEFLKDVKSAKYPEDFDYKTAYHEHLEDKYGK